MMKKIMEARITSNEEISDSIYRIVLRCEEAAAHAEPGQFVNIYLNDKSMLLPRPISICFTEEDRMTLVYRVVGKGTKELSSYRTGELLSVSTPLGRGYDLQNIFESLEQANSGIRKIALTAGGLGVPPMLELAKVLRKRIAEENDKTIQLAAVLGFQNEGFLIDEAGKFCDEVLVSTENGSTGFHGNVLEMMESKRLKADYYLACGPKPMLKALSQYCSKIEKPLQVSLEERMGCGYGACVGCTCKTRESNDSSSAVIQKKVCKDGPVFFGNEVIWDE